MPTPRTYGAVEIVSDGVSSSEDDLFGGSVFQPFELSLEIIRDMKMDRIEICGRS
jgi:hypothetical protein